MKKNTKSKPMERYKRCLETHLMPVCILFRRLESTSGRWMRLSWRRSLLSHFCKHWTITLMEWRCWRRIDRIWEKWYLAVLMERLLCGAYLHERRCFRLMRINSKLGALHLLIIVLFPPILYLYQQEMIERLTFGRLINSKSNMNSLDPV